MIPLSTLNVFPFYFNREGSIYHKYTFIWSIKFKIGFAVIITSTYYVLGTQSLFCFSFNITDKK